MNEPIRIDRDAKEISNDEYLAILKQKHAQKMQWFFLGFITLLVAGFLTPLIVWLTRLAIG